MLIDTQLHLIDQVRFPMSRQSGGYLPGPEVQADHARLIAVLDRHDVAKGVLVQPSGYGSDNTALFEALEEGGERFRAVVMCAQGAVPELVSAGAKAVRLNMTDFAGHDPKRAAELGKAVLERGLALQVQAGPEPLEQLLDRLPDGSVIIDHLGRPDPHNDTSLARVAAMAQRPETWLKVSGGFRIEDDWRRPTSGLRDLVARWPSDRVIWGSDWPFLNCGGQVPRYGETLAWGRKLTDLDIASRNAAQLFGWADG